MSILAVDTSIEVVKFSAKRKDGGGTTTYYFSSEFWEAGAIYSGSPVVYPLLANSPELTREVSRIAAVRGDSRIQLFAKSDFTAYGYSVADLLNSHVFHGAAVEVRYYAKPSDTTTTHSDSVNIRNTLEVINSDYDDGSGILTLECRDTWFKNRDYGHRFETADFDSNVTDYLNTWRTEMGPVPFGTDSTGTVGTVLTVCPLYDAETATDGTHTYQTFKIITGFSPGSGSGYSPGFKKLYVRNDVRQLNVNNWLEVNLQANGFASRTPLAGPSTLDSGTTELSGKQWRIARRIAPSTKAELVTGVSLRTKRVGQITHGDGQLQISFIEAVEVASNKWSTTGSVFRSLPLDASAIGTSAGNVDFHFTPPVILPPGKSYFCIAEWTRSTTESKTITGATNASPIAITTSGDHGWANGDSVTITGVLGNTAANGTFTITSTGATTFTLDSSTGSGAYTSGGTAERNKYCSLYYDNTVGADVFYANDQTVNKEGWGATTGEAQLQLWTVGLNNASGTVNMTDYTLNYAEIHALASGTVPVNFSGLEFKVGMSGLNDDGSGTYTGTADALIDNPVAIIKFLLMESNFGVGLTSSSVNTTVFNTVRDECGSAQDMCFSVEGTITIEELIKRICDQARLIIYKERAGKMTIIRPTHPTSYDFLFNEGAMRGELVLEDVSDMDSSFVINSMEGVYKKDVLQLNTDPAFLRISRDSRFLELEYTYGNGVGFSTSDATRPDQALASQVLYGLRESLERYDLYETAAPVRHCMDYKFDRFKDQQRRVTFRVNRRDYYSTALDLFSTGRISHQGILAASGSASEIGQHYQGTPITTYDEGVPCVIWAGGTIKGFVSGIREQGRYMYVTLETISSIPAVVLTG